ncbi:hypothetical protein CC78DRAFT_581293 [Lojkania enalia]|uniref:Fork-head domain-containing protein n=1 Tax=Lojkania enalia TaxID=147567 RepID=A0A9P4K7M9_9PLEO|nr:hypothetical protein CC78DRAFT_581293 [Didymosphaeria enalia]
MKVTSVATTFPESDTYRERHLPAAIMRADDAATPPLWTTQYPFPLGRTLALPNADGTGYQDLPPGYTPESPTTFDYTPHGLSFSDNYNLAFPTLIPSSSCPRAYAHGLGFPSSMSSMPNSYPPSAYLLEPQRPQEVLDIPNMSTSSQLPQMQLNDDFEDPVPRAEWKEHPTYSQMQSSEDSGLRSAPQDAPSMGHSDVKIECLGDDAVDKEQPYAQLIYRALMEAPGHTMILRDIYNWFKENTDKAADKETKGWQNSIRHNLSMNGAFEKVDQPGDETKKGFLWKLTEEAIREGVKSTTRYRSKQPNKRGHRSGHPQPQRQISGAKGGQASKRSAKLRRSNRMNGFYANPRSVPPDGPYSPGYESAFDIGIPLSTSPYYTSDSDSGQSIDLGGIGGYSPGSPTAPVHSYPASSHEPLVPNGFHVILPIDPQEPLFYDDTPSNTSSPPADEPLTPSSVGDWETENGYPTVTPYIFDDYNPNYRESLH